MFPRAGRALLICLALGAAVPSAPAFADPPSWGMWQVLRERYHRPSETDDDYRVVYVPHARVAHADFDEGGVVPVARGLPWGLNRGTCDRDRITPQQGESAPAGLVVEGSDRDCVIAALEMLPDQRQIAWAGDAGEIFRVTTEQSYQASGLLCRDYSAQIQVGGRKQQTFGTACRRPDGQWDILD
jgi:hypothetical protein